ncbi:MAG: sigma-70 family RNA polymerase sigma factor [Leptolyngbya sp. SIO4C1]|nr:sigma-70 family RNA polymerase sigma factor [Leptolyngbya sp. SIO4C1]
MCESPLDEYLEQLAVMAQQQPSGSRERRKALAKLISVLQNSKQLTRPRRGQFQGFYEDIYREALQRLFTYMCDRIDDYNPERGKVLQWVNFLLSRRFFIEASREVLPTVPKGLDPKTVTRLSLDDLDTSPPSDPQQAPALSDDLKYYIREDPDGTFQKTCIANQPHANFQYIALKRLEGYSWKDLSAELALGISTLSSFYQRCINRFAAKCRQDLL